MVCYIPMDIKFNILIFIKLLEEELCVRIIYLTLMNFLLLKKHIGTKVRQNTYDKLKQNNSLH